jgi:hypothetical protein
MIPSDEQCADLLDSGDPGLARVVTDLDRMRRVATAARVAPARDAAIRRALHDRALEQIHSARADVGGQAGAARPRPRLAALAGALLLALSGVLGGPHLSAPAPVSAQDVLRRAAAAMRLAPSQAAHLSYRVAIAPPRGQLALAVYAHRGAGKARYRVVAGTVVFTAEVWVRAAAGGAPTASMQTLTWPGTHQFLVDRYIQVGSQIYGYDPGNNEIALRGTHDEQPGWLIPNGALDGAGLTRELSALALHAPRQVRLLPRQSLGGTAVEAIQVDGWRDAPGLRTTFYFDAHTFLLRGFDAGSRDPTYPTASWQVRLGSYATVAAGSVPPRTFTLRAPADAQVASPILDSAAFASTFTTVCHRAFDVSRLLQIRQVRRQSLLAA